MRWAETPELATVAIATTTSVHRSFISPSNASRRLQQGIERLAYRPDAHQFAGSRTVRPLGRTDLSGSLVQRFSDARIDVGLRHHGAAESHLGCLARAQWRLRDATDLAGETDLAKDGGGGRDDPITNARRNSSQHTEVGRRFVYGHPARHVYEHIIANTV